MPRFRIFAKQQELCPFHGAQSHMNGVYSHKKEEWAPYKDKVFEEPHRLENSSLSLKDSQYKEKLSPETKTFFEDLYITIHKVNMESYSKQALHHITIIRHKVESNEAKLLMLGCKKWHKKRFL